MFGAWECGLHTGAVRCSRGCGRTPGLRAGDGGGRCGRAAARLRSTRNRGAISVKQCANAASHPALPAYVAEGAVLNGRWPCTWLAAMAGEQRRNPPAHHGAHLDTPLRYAGTGGQLLPDVGGAKGASDGFLTSRVCQARHCSARVLYVCNRAEQGS